LIYNFIFVKLKWGAKWGQASNGGPCPPGPLLAPLLARGYWEVSLSGYRKNCYG